MKIEGIIALCAVLGGAMAWFSKEFGGYPAKAPTYPTAGPEGVSRAVAGPWELPVVEPVTMVTRAGWESAKAPAIGEVGTVTVGAMPGEAPGTQRVYETVPVAPGNPVNVTYEVSTGVPIPVQITAPPTEANPVPTSVQIVDGATYYMGMRIGG